MALAQCPEHGDFLIRVRLSPETGGTFRVSRLTYQGDSEAALAYAKRAEKAESTRQTRRRRRRPAGGAKPAQAPPSCQTSYPSGESWKYVRILSANTVGMLQRKGAYQRCLICCYFCLLLPSQVSRRSP